MLSLVMAYNNKTVTSYVIHCCYGGKTFSQAEASKISLSSSLGRTNPYQGAYPLNR